MLRQLSQQRAAETAALLRRRLGQADPSDGGKQPHVGQPAEPAVVGVVRQGRARLAPAHKGTSSSLQLQPRLAGLPQLPPPAVLWRRRIVGVSIAKPAAGDAPLSGAGGGNEIVAKPSIIRILESSLGAAVAGVAAVLGRFNSIISGGEANR